ncbi:MAG: SIR2 family protein [Theionarchaea archaeon]|nr:SIR2 family protein [Theionarchaea archaeon]
MSVHPELALGYTPIIIILAKKMLSETTKKVVRNKDFIETLNRRIEETLKEERISRQEQISELTTAYRNEELVLVLGSGISTEHNLPDWNTLLQKLLINAFMIEMEEPKERSSDLAKLFTSIFPLSPLVAARYLHEYYRDNPKSGENGISFEEAIREALYEEMNLEDESPLYKEILQFCIAPDKSPNLDCIITYNYDDILKTYLSALDIDIPYETIYSSGANPPRGVVPIYHVHGFLPQNKRLTKENRIILSEDMYHQQYLETYNWSNMVQIEKFRDKTCLFIGVSFTDPNLRRLLDIAKSLRGESARYHYCIRKRDDPKVVEDILSLVLEQEQRKESSIKEKIPPQELEETAKQLIAMKEQFEENDASSFGLRIIWVKDYAEIPTILEDIRSENSIKNGIEITPENKDDPKIQAIFQIIKENIEKRIASGGKMDEYTIQEVKTISRDIVRNEFPEEEEYFDFLFDLTMQEIEDLEP